MRRKHRRQLNVIAYLRIYIPFSVGSSSTCCKPGPSLILGSAPQGGFSHWADHWPAMRRWRGTSVNDDGWMMYYMNVMEWMNVIYNIKINKESGIMVQNLYLLHCPYWFVSNEPKIYPDFSLKISVALSDLIKIFFSSWCSTHTHTNNSMR